jgi:RNase P subunit RPR2
MKTAVREKTPLLEEKKLTPLKARTAHAHHWVIASPNGEYSAGTCKVCGKTKRFPNSAEDNLWSRNVPQSRWTGRSDGDPGGY